MVCGGERRVWRVGGGGILGVLQAAGEVGGVT
jgi:hypothetical protein